MTTPANEPASGRTPPAPSTEYRVTELAHQNLREYGTIFNTLAAVCDVHGSVEAVARTEGDAT